MEQLFSVAALMVVVGGLLTILMVLGWPIVHRPVVVLRLRSGLHRIDEVLAGWQQESGGWHAPREGI